MQHIISKKVKIHLSSTEEIEVPYGTNLRAALRSNFSQLYNFPSNFVNCHGFGTCGTCSLFVKGPVSKSTRIERWRLNFPPHKDSLKKGLRLACQTQVLGDIEIEKWDGMWGQRKRSIE